MSTTKAATSVAITRPKDVLAAVDARSSTTSQALTKPPANQNNFLTQGLDKLKNSGLDAKDLGDVISIKDGKLGVDIRQAGPRVDQVAGSSISGIITSDNQDVKARALAGIAGLYGDDQITSIITDTGNILRIDKNTDTSSARSLVGAVSRLLSDTAIGTAVDQSAYLSTGRALLEAAISMGMPEMIDALKNKFEDDREAKAKLINGVKGVILRSDLDTLDKIIGWIGVSGVLSKVPDAVQLLLAAYAFPPGTTPEKYAECKTNLLNMLNRLNPNWLYTDFQGVQVYNFEVFTRASFNAVTLLNLDTVDTIKDSNGVIANPYLVPTLIAPQYRVVDLQELTLKKYPQLGLWR
jgi:hypothetical protein